LRDHLSRLTRLPAPSIETAAESMPALPEVRQTDDLAGKTVQTNAALQAANEHAMAQRFRARGEHRALWPTADFASQYALLATFNNYQDFFRPGSFQKHNATIGVVLRFPFLNPSQHARAAAADADAAKAKSDAQAAKNQASEQTLKLQRSVEQLAAFQQVSQLEYEVAQANANALQVRLDAGTASFHDVEDARDQAKERFNALQDANFEVERARIALLRGSGAGSRWPATREIESYWYPVWLAYPAGMLEGARLLDAPPHYVSAEDTIKIAQDYEFLVLFTSTPGFPGDIRLAQKIKDANPK